MPSDGNDVRLLLSQELEAIRSKIVAEELVLFVGEQVSTLVTPENPSPSLDYWSQIVNHSAKVHVTVQPSLFFRSASRITKSANHGLAAFLRSNTIVKRPFITPARVSDLQALTVRIAASVCKNDRLV